MSGKCYIVNRSVKDGHEHKLIIFGVYDGKEDAQERMKQVAENFVEEYQSDNFSARIDRVEPTYIRVTYGMGASFTVGIRDVPKNEAISETITVWT